MAAAIQAGAIQAAEDARAGAGTHGGGTSSAQERSEIKAKKWL